MPWYPLSSRLWRFRLGWNALFTPKNSFGPDNAMAWTTFYLTEEREERLLPNVEFARMLVQHGLPDVGNPLPNDHEDYFLLHPGGFIAAEFDRCLRPAQNDLDIARGESALLRLGLLAHLNCPMTSAKNYWADDDLQYAMALACVEGRWDLYGARPSRVIVNALRNLLLAPEVAPGVLIARRIAEEQWHPAPWSPQRWAKPVPANPTSEDAPPAPTLNVASWRQKRLPGPQQNGEAS